MVKGGIDKRGMVKAGIDIRWTVKAWIDKRGRDKSGGDGLRVVKGEGLRVV